MLRSSKIHFSQIIFFCLFIFFNTNTSLLANTVKNLNRIENIAFSDENSNNKIKSEYILGPGDRVFIEFRNIEIFSGNYPINAEGYIYLPELGNVYSSGMTISELEENLVLIYEDIIYNPSISISITNYRPVNIYVYGEVNKPGLYTLNFSNNRLSNSRIGEETSTTFATSTPKINPRIFDAIKLAEGVTQNADLANIKVIRKNTLSQGGGKIQTKINLLTLIKEGDHTQNIRLFDSDTLFIPKSTKILKDQIDSIDKTNLNPDFITVYIGGNVENPGSIRLSKGTTLVQGIIATGGNKSTSSIGKIEFMRFDPEGNINKKAFNFNLASKKDSPKNPTLKNGDIINVRKSVLSKSSEVISTVGKPLIQGYGIYNIFN